MSINLVVFSACSFPKRKSPYNHPALAGYSNYLAKKHGYKTRLYTDIKNYDLLKNIDYDEIIFLDEDIIKQFPERGWSLGKILAMSMVNQPFIHIDFDLLLVNNIPDNLQNEQCFVFHNEPHIKFNKKIMTKLYNKYNNLNEIDIKYFQSKNCAIFGANDYQTVNKCCKKIINYAINNRILLDKYSNIIFKYEQDNIFIAVFLEQIFLLNLIRKKIKYIPTIIPYFYFKDISKHADELKLVHLWGGKSNFINKFNQLAKDKNIKF